MGNMIVDETSYMTIVSNVAARVGITIPTSSSSDDAVGKKLRAIYPTAIQSVLELGVCSQINISCHVLRRRERLPHTIGLCEVYSPWARE